MTNASTSIVADPAKGCNFSLQPAQAVSRLRHMAAPLATAEVSSPRPISPSNPCRSQLDPATLAHRRWTALYLWHLAALATVGFIALAWEVHRPIDQLIGLLAGGEGSGLARFDYWRCTPFVWSFCSLAAGIALGMAFEKLAPRLNWLRTPAFIHMFLALAALSFAAQAWAANPQAARLWGLIGGRWGAWTMSAVALGSWWLGWRITSPTPASPAAALRGALPAWESVGARFNAWLGRFAPFAIASWLAMKQALPDPRAALLMAPALAVILARLFSPPPITAKFRHVSPILEFAVWCLIIVFPWVAGALPVMHALIACCALACGALGIGLWRHRLELKPILQPASLIPWSCLALTILFGGRMASLLRVDWHMSEPLASILGRGGIRAGQGSAGGIISIGIGLTAFLSSWIVLRVDPRGRWWLALLIGLASPLAGGSKIILSLPAWVVAACVLRGLKVGRLKWWTLAGFLAGSIGHFHIPLALWSIVSLIVFSLIWGRIVTRSTDADAAQRHFPSIAVGLGLLPLLLGFIVVVALTQSFDLMLNRTAGELRQLQAMAGEIFQGALPVILWFCMAYLACRVAIWAGGRRPILATGVALLLSIHCILAYLTAMLLLSV